MRPTANHVDDLIRAIESTKDVHVEVAGDGTCRTNWQDLANELGAPVTFHGCLSGGEMLDVLRCADVFCMPGTAELQSIATLEAMAAGLPVIAANAMALPHLVHPGENGDLYPPGDIPALVAALIALTDPAVRIEAGRASRRIAAGHDLALELSPLTPSGPPTKTWSFRGDSPCLSKRIPRSRYRPTSLNGCCSTGAIATPEGGVDRVYREHHGGDHEDQRESDR